jgi:cytochrome oxidase Cu insertion factor (SCO1/SenC/PrrC family)
MTLHESDGSAVDGEVGKVQVPKPRVGRPSGSTTFVLLGLAVLLAAVFAVFAVRYHNQHDQISSIRATGIPASVPTSLANLMLLSPVPVHSAPNFTLVDQAGHTLSLSSFEGRAVVLEFMDPHCTDICPIVSQEFVDDYRDLGKAASHVVFVAVNVNQYYTGVADMASFSRSHRLDSIPSWHFFTGSPSALASVWHDYGIEVAAPNPKADIVHTSVVYFIDPHGRERYLASPSDDKTASGAAYLPSSPLASWGQGIALVTQSFAR